MQCENCQNILKGNVSSDDVCIYYTKERIQKPFGTWDGRDQNFEFQMKGKSDSDYAKDTDSRKSISGTSVFLNEAPVCMRSGQQESTTLSTTESELVAGTQCAQDVLYVYKIMTSIGLKVKLPMILEIDNRGTVDLANNWSIGGRTRHIEVRQYFVRELKEAGLLQVKWISGDEMSSDLFTKNLPGNITQLKMIKLTRSFKGRVLRVETQEFDRM